METIKQQALRMACDTFLCGYSVSPPTLERLDEIVEFAIVMEQFESFSTEILKDLIMGEYTSNLMELEHLVKSIQANPESIGAYLV